jgi:hypothetical protein
MEVIKRLGTEEIHISDTALAKLQAKADNGDLLVEFGYPKVPDGSSPQSRMGRYSHIDKTNVCAKITKVHRGEDGAVYGTVLPLGPKSKILKQLMRSGNDGKVTFGVRALSGIGQQPEIVTFDLIKF